MQIRNEVERIIKEQELNRNRAFEVSKTKYTSIIQNIERIFVLEGKTIHWSNMGYFKKSILCKHIQICNSQLWYHSLSEIVPRSEEAVYVLLEDRKGYQAKYWLYEIHIPELIAILDDIEGLDDFYIVSKKYNWLISENHEEVASFLGEELDCSMFETAV